MMKERLTLREACERFFGEKDHLTMLKEVIRLSDKAKQEMMEMLEKELNIEVWK